MVGACFMFRLQILVFLLDGGESKRDREGLFRFFFFFFFFFFFLIYASETVGL